MIDTRAVSAVVVPAQAGTQPAFTADGSAARARAV